MSIFQGHTLRRKGRDVIQKLCSLKEINKRRLLLWGVEQWVEIVMAVFKKFRKALLGNELQYAKILKE